MKKNIGRLGAAVGFLGFLYIFGNKVVTATKKIRMSADKYYLYFLMANQWITLKQKGVTIEDYLTKHRYHKIAIYGMAELGEMLYRELDGTSVEVAYAIDASAGRLLVHYCNILSPTDELPEVDAVIVTPIPYFKDIEKKLSKKLECPIISLEEVLCEVLYHEE